MTLLRDSKRGEVPWLAAASEPDERHLVGWVLDTYVAMKEAPVGSPEWERLSAKHDGLLDALAIIFKMRGKYVEERLP